MHPFYVRLTTVYHSFKCSINSFNMFGFWRYDHFSVLCEILPVAIPSLLASLTYLNHPYQLPVSTILESTSEKLGCESILNRCSYPGASATYHVLRLREIKVLCYQYEITCILLLSLISFTPDGVCRIKERVRL